MFHQRVVPSRSSAGTFGRIDGIETLRGIAAVAVVLYHSARHVERAVGEQAWARVFHPGHAGVDLFFVLSGFIILLVHRRDVGRPERVGRFAWRRFARVWPLYWLALATTIAVEAAGGARLPDVGTLVWNLTLLPTPGEPIVGIAWTLQFEAVFYFLFGLLIVDRRLGVVALGGWLMLAAAGVAAGWQVKIASSAFAVEFFLGMGVALAVRGEKIGRPLAWTMGGAALFALAWAAEAIGALDGYSAAARVAYGMPAAMIVAGVAAGRPGVPRWLASLGSASYAVYLFHLLGFAVAWQAFTRLGIVMPAAGWFVVLAGSGVVMGLAMHRLVERPMLAALRR